MDKKRTLWERATGANAPAPPVPNETKVYNPLNAKIGATVQLDVLDHRGTFYRLAALDEIDRHTNIPMTDYCLTVSLTPTNDQTPVWLRAVPFGVPWTPGKHDCRLIALSVFFECGWDDAARPGIMEGVKDPAGEFVINPDTPETKKYWRLHGLKTSETATVSNVRTSDGPIVTCQMEMWGYSRITQDEAKQDVTEYLYVQKDSKTGWLTVLVGQEIPPERVLV